MKKKLKILSLLFFTLLFCSCGFGEVISPETGDGEIISSEKGDNEIISPEKGDNKVISPEKGDNKVISPEAGDGETISSETGDGVLASFSAIDIDNNIVSQDIFADSKLTMVNIWGTFCSPCVEEMPILAEFGQEYADQGFQVVGIIIDAADKNLVIKQNKLDSAREITAATNAGYIHLLPSKSLNDALLADIQSVPYTIFVNSEGYQVGESYPGAKTKQEWQKIITALLEAQD